MGEFGWDASIEGKCHHRAFWVLVLRESLELADDS
jgi:hypothetical protein